MKQQKRVTARFTEEEYEQMLKLVSAGFATSVADLMRKSVILLLMDRFRGR